VAKEAARNAATVQQPSAQASASTHRSPRFGVDPEKQSQSMTREAADAAPNIEHAEDKDGNTSEPDPDNPFAYRHYIDGSPEKPGGARSVSATSPPQIITTIEQPSAVQPVDPHFNSIRGPRPRVVYKWIVWSPERGNRISRDEVPGHPPRGPRHRVVYRWRVWSPRRGNRRNLPNVPVSSEEMKQIDELIDARGEWT